MRLEVACEAVSAPEGLEALLARVGDVCLAAEGIGERCGAALLLTDDNGIALLNRERRGLDVPTDVLSFPSVRYGRGAARDSLARLRRERDPETGFIHLGDIALSLPRAREQAAAYGHSLAREAGFLFAHAMLHLLGHDHGPLMREREELIMEKAGLPRDLEEEDLALIAAARKAMEKAYAPYSGYRVGACVRAGDGRLFTGCNVENVSFGLTICAERGAVAAAVAGGARTLSAIAVASEGSLPLPCGACRQVLREFAQDMPVLLSGADGVRVTSLSLLLPDSFGPDALAGGKP